MNIVARIHLPHSQSKPVARRSVKEPCSRFSGFYVETRAVQDPNHSFAGVRFGEDGELDWLVSQNSSASLINTSKRTVINTEMLHLLEAD